jgi:hypothetical protein
MTKQTRSFQSHFIITLRLPISQSTSFLSIVDQCRFGCFRQANKKFQFLDGKTNNRRFGRLACFAFRRICLERLRRRDPKTVEFVAKSRSASQCQDDIERNRSVQFDVSIAYQALDGRTDSFPPHPHHYNHGQQMHLGPITFVSCCHVRCRLIRERTESGLA